MARAAPLALLGMSAFWMATAWPAATGGMLLAAVICSLFAKLSSGELYTRFRGRTVDPGMRLNRW